MAIAPASGDTTAPEQIEPIEGPIPTVSITPDIPSNFILKFVDTNLNRAINIEPDTPTIIMLDLKKNVITRVR